jgi:hypothetical protein
MPIWVNFVVTKAVKDVGKFYPQFAYFTAIWYYGHLVYFMAFWVYFYPFWYFVPGKNPATLISTKCRALALLFANFHFS